MSYLNSGRIVSAMCGTYTEAFAPRDADNTIMKTISWSDPRDPENTGNDLIRILDIDTIRKALDKNYADDRESLFVLAGDPTTFWNVHLYFEEMGTIGLTHWDNMISAAMEDPDVALIGYEEVPGHPGPGQAAWGSGSSLSSSQDEERPMCKFYQQGSCRYGATCWYSHGQAPKKPAQQQQSRSLSSNRGGSSASGGGAPICKFFNSPQGCRFGDTCRFAHVSEGGIAPSQQATTETGAELEGEDDEIDFTSVGGKDYINPCSQCGKVPSVSGTGLCSMCCFGREDWDQ